MLHIVNKLSLFVAYASCYGLMCLPVVCICCKLKDAVSGFGHTQRLLFPVIE
jgi:hypothetical protein